MKSAFVAAAVVTLIVGTALPSVQARGLVSSGGSTDGSGYRSYLHPHYNAYDQTLPRWKVLRKLEHRGYHGFHDLHLEGQIYKVRAHKLGQVYKIWVNAYTGNIVSSRPVT